jgi:NADH-quinone oxidoreductase subunit B
VTAAHVYRAATDHAYDLEVMNVGLACCAMEFVAATRLRDEVLQTREIADGEETVKVLVVSGTVTAKTADSVTAAFDALPEPKRVMAFGSCANSGGPYWDSHTVIAGVDRLIPVDVYVAGCPPRPEALLDGLRELDRLIAEESR